MDHTPCIDVGVLAVACLLTLGIGAPVYAQSVFINELHYDNAGTDTGESVEIAGPAGTDLSGWSLVLYNGNGGTVYNTRGLSGLIPDQGNGFGTLVFSYPSDGVQNGSPDGVALVDASNTVVQFLSYEGIFMAVGGPANGLTSTDIAVLESSTTPIGSSLQLTGSGTVYTDFAWSSPSSSTFGAINTAQTFGSVVPTGCGDPATAIFAIQGSGTISPLDGTTVTVEAIVTGDFQASDGVPDDLNGFYLQEAVGDGNPTTSDGIFVFEGSSPDVNILPGDRVRVTGTVDEFFGETQIVATSVVTCGTTGTVTPTNVNLPVTNVLVNSDGALIPDLEQYEGMLVRFPQILRVTELFNLDRFGELQLAQGGRLFQFTNSNAPSVPGYQAHLENLATRTITLDDGLTIQNPDPIRFPAPELDSDNTVRMGDTITHLTGNLRFSRGSGGAGDETYRLMPTEEPTFVRGNARPATPPAVGGSLKVVSTNVLNFFNDLADGTGQCFPSGTAADCRGATSQAEFERQLDKLVTALSALNADIYGLIELENDYPDGAHSAIATLVDALNTSGTARCSGNFAYVDPGARVGDDAIAVGVIYCTTTVRLAPGTHVVFLQDSDFPGLGFDPGDNVFNGFATSRSPLAATFQQISNGQVFTVVVNHYKSKGDSGLATDPVCLNDPLRNPNCDQGDGQSFWNARRRLASQAIDIWLATHPTGTTDPDYLLIGDFNAYVEEDPTRDLEIAGYTNLLRTLEGQPYSFVFDAQAGALDHAFASASLARQVTGVGEWHVNADEPDALDYNLDFGRNPALFDGTMPFRAADHDPLMVGLALASAPASPCHCSAPGAITGGAGPDVLVGTFGDDIICGFSGNDLILALGGNDCIESGSGTDLVLGGLGNDRIFGGAGNDLLSGNGGQDQLEGGEGFDEIVGGAGQDTCTNGEIVFGCEL